MKKLLISLTVLTAIIGINNIPVKADTEPVVKIEIPASTIDSIDVNYEKQNPSPAQKAVNATKDVTDKTVKATKKATKKTVDVTKDVTDKTVKTTKRAAKKTVDKTKDVTDKTIDGAKDVIDNLNPNKPTSLEDLETSASIKTLKDERNQIKSAYNSKIKDVNAQINAAEKSTTITDVQRQNKIYTLNKEKNALILQRDKEILKYNNKISTLKNKK